MAQKWADHLRDDDCAFDHSRGAYGENLAMGTTGYMPAEAVVDMWHAEVGDYDFANPGFGMSTGHFTQLVWRNTTQLGCASAQCAAKNMTIWVCNYDPPGNYEGEYPAQVLPASCKR